MKKKLPERSRGRTELEAALDARMNFMTPAARSIAAYFREHMATLSFETGAQLARSIGVSEMTIIRFVRDLGYANLRDLKNRLKPKAGDAEVLDDVRERFTNRASDIGHLTDSMALELEAVQRAYEMTTTRRWDRIIELISKLGYIYVAGFQATQGVALDFASRLKYVRSGVRYAHSTTGVYSDVLESNPDNTVLVVIDTASYSRKGILLTQKARELGIPLVIITDRFSHWAREYTDNLLEMNTHVGTFWDSTASLSVILNLLIHSVASRLGDSALERFRYLRELGDHFNEFDAAASRFGETARLDRRRD
ncbi:MAG: hypothetical protein DHS20C01_00230 [marine bacterium B5-7]|nr:MAG: hypothetical protein DHS20C01_00230 [marine bacterium B5-7]